jgi:uncharacterized protein (DUF433 family)
MSQLPTLKPGSCSALDRTIGRDLADVKIAGIYHSDPETMSGAPVFVGTRVPVKTLFDYLESGESIEGFLADFPTVSKEMTVALLEIAAEMLLDHAPNC